MKQLIIINECSIATKYGVGTYTDQLIQCMADDYEWEVNVIELFCPTVSELSIQNKNGIHYYQFPILEYYGNEKYYTKINSRYYKSVFYILAPFINKEITIVHFNFVHGYELATLLKTISTVKIVLTLHYTTWSFEFLGERERIEKILVNPITKSEKRIKGEFEREQKFMKECCDQIIAIARHSKEMIESLYGIEKQKVSLISNAIRDEFVKIEKEEKIRIREKYNFSRDENIFIFAGRLEKVKGILILIDAFKLLLKIYPNSKLIISGTGDFTTCLESSNPVWSKIVFTGFVKKAQLYELFSICDIGIVPSIHEEFGLVALEMMMNSLPLIVGKTSGLDEIVTNDCGCKIKISDESKESAIDLMNAMVKLLRKRTDAENFATNARKFYLSNYELNGFQHRMKNKYYQLCQK
ncbi:MAG TPA: hypothetical protein DDZ57_04890 [Porphyromonadaceae bacterium]|jgi:glycosyltransferase|nr:hypothetical protein [Porphyromonadaceae bacterium]